MKPVLYSVMFLLLSVVVVVTAGCLSPGGGDGEETISGTGVVTYIDLEGGFYGVVSDDGEKYDPINLGAEFQVDGLRVSFEVKIREDMVSTHMWGTLVEIVKIEKLK